MTDFEKELVKFFRSKRDLGKSAIVGTNSLVNKNIHVDARWYGTKLK